MKITKKLVRIIDFSLLGAIALTAGITSAVIMGKSKAEYDDYYNEVFDIVEFSKPVSMEVSLKEGIAYYKNNKASPSAEDFNVKVKFIEYGTEDKEFEYVLDMEKHPYKIEYDSDFYLNGGEITFSYKKLTHVVNFELIDVVIDRIEIAESPYTISYPVGETFKKEGMVVNVVKNDGEKKTLSENEYQITVDSPLTEQTKEFVVKYTDGGKTYEVSHPIKVSSNYKLGDLTGLQSRGDVYVNHGDVLANSSYTLLGSYSSGNKKVVNKDEVTIENGSEVAEFGSIHNIQFKHNTFTNVKASLPVIVKNKVEGELADIIGGEVKEEPEYVYDASGNIVSTNTEVAFAGNFAKSVQNGQDAYIQFAITSSSNNVGNITMRCANSYLVQDSATELYSMKPLKINTIADLYVNGKLVNIANDVVLKGCGPAEGYAELYNIYSEFTFENINFIGGNNTIKLQFKNSTENAVTSWNESPSTMNIDYIVAATLGGQKPSLSSVKSIEIDESFRLYNGDKLEEVYVPVLATTKNNESFLVLASDCNVDWNGKTGIVTPGTYTCNVSLKQYPNIKTSKTFTVEQEAIYLQSESASITGDTSKVKSASGTEWVNGSNTNQTITVVGGMDNSTTKYSGTTSLTHTYTSNAAGSAKLYIKCSNANETKKSAPYSAPSYELNQVVKVQVNGQDVTFKAIIPAVSHATEADCDWWTFTELEIGDIQLQKGENKITIIGDSKSTLRNCWNEIPVPKFDYIKLVK